MCGEGYPMRAPVWVQPCSIGWWRSFGIIARAGNRPQTTFALYLTRACTHKSGSRGSGRRCDVRYAPESGTKADIAGLPRCADTVAKVADESHEQLPNLWEAWG